MNQNKPRKTRAEMESEMFMRLAEFEALVFPYLESFANFQDRIFQHPLFFWPSLILSVIGVIVVSLGFFVGLILEVFGLIKLWL